MPKFSSRTSGFKGFAPPKLLTDERYDLKGINLVAPDQSLPDGKSPLAFNCRRFARNEGDSRVAIRSRRGSTPLSDGGRLLLSDTRTGTDQFEVDSKNYVAQSLFRILINENSVVTRIDLDVKTITAGYGNLVVAIHVNDDGELGNKVAESSIAPGDIGDDFEFKSVFFMDAPSLLDRANYRVAIRVDGTDKTKYALRKTDQQDAGVRTSANAGKTWINNNDCRLRNRVYASNDAPITGYTRRNSSDGTFFTMIATNDRIYRMADSGGGLIRLGGSLLPGVQKVRFVQIEDKTVWVDGVGPAQWWNGRGNPTDIPNVPGVAQTHVAVHQNRLFFVPKDEPTRINYSNIFPDLETYSPFSFVYIPTPKSSDFITAMVAFQGGLTVFTRTGKYLAHVSTVFADTIDELVSNQGAVSQEGVALGRDHVYFMSDDHMIYAWNGVKDEPLSLEIEPELQQISDLSKVRLHYHRNQLRVYYNADNQDRMAIYDFTQGEWFIDTGRKVMGSLSWELNNDELIEFSSACAWVFRGEQGYSDLGKPIAFRYWTRYDSYGSGMEYTKVKSFFPLVRAANTPYYLNVGKDVDFVDRPELDRYLVDSKGIRWDSRVLYDTGKRYDAGNELVDRAANVTARKGLWIQYRFEANNIGVPVWLIGYQVRYKLAGKKLRGGTIRGI